MRSSSESARNDRLAGDDDTCRVPSLCCPGRRQRESFGCKWSVQCHPPLLGRRRPPKKGPLPPSAFYRRREAADDATAFDVLHPQEGVSGGIGAADRIEQE